MNQTNTSNLSKNDLSPRHDLSDSTKKKKKRKKKRPNVAECVES